MLSFCLVHPYYFVAVNVHNIMLIKGISEDETEVYLQCPPVCLLVDAPCAALRHAVVAVTANVKKSMEVHPNPYSPAMKRMIRLSLVDTQ